MDSPGVWKQSHKSSYSSKEDIATGNAASIPGSSAWGALKSNSSQKAVKPATVVGGWSASDKEASNQPASDSCWPANEAPQSNVSGGLWDSSQSVSTSVSDSTWVTAGNNKESGWGTPSANPDPNAGTENWNQQSSELGRLSLWGSDAKNTTPGTLGWSSTQEKESRSDVWGQSLVHQETTWNLSAERNDASVNATHVDLEHNSSWDGNVTAANIACSKQETSPWGASNVQTTAVSPTSETNTWTQTPVRSVVANGPAKGSSEDGLPNPTLARDELIARAINTQDGWGKTPIRQDTVWDVSGCELPAGAAVVKPTAVVEEMTARHSATSSNGTAIWESSKENMPVPSVNHPSSLGTLHSTTTAGYGEAIPPNWGIPGAVGDRSLPLQPVAVSAAGSWNNHIESQPQILPVGSAWNSGNDISSNGWDGEFIGDVARENLVGARGAAGLGLAATRNHSSGVLDSIENVQSAVGAPWTGSLFTGTKCAVETAVSDTCHPWGDSLQANSTLSLPLSSTTSTIAAASKLNSVTDIWSRPEPLNGINRSSSVPWGEAVNESIWNPISLPKPVSGWNSDAKWSATNQKLKGWGDSGDCNASAEEKRVEYAPFSLSNNSGIHNDLSNDMIASQRRMSDIDQTVVSSDLNSGRVMRGGMVPTIDGQTAIHTPVADMGLGGIRPGAAIATNLNFPPPSISSLQFAASMQQAKTQQSHAQQLIQHSQLLQQLQAAGHIPPSLMSGSTQAPPPPPALVIAVQQMLQLQQLLQRLQVQQAAALQSKLPRPPAGTDPLAITIAKIRQQIGALQVQIQSYRQQLIQPGLGGQFDVTSHDIAREFSAALQVRSESSGNGQWKSMPGSDTSVLLPPSHNNDCVPLPSASSLISNPSSSSMNGWPGWPGMPSARSLGGGENILENADCAARGSASMEATIPQTSSGDTSNAANLDIEEFVPGKPWQGPTIRSADEDPFVTPGSVSRGPFNLGAVDDMRILNMLGSKVSPNPVTSSSPTWGLNDARGVAGGWPRSISTDQDMFGSGVSKGVVQRTPPGLAMPTVPWHQSAQHPSFNRSTSWAPRSSFDLSNSIVIKNLPIQIDAGIVKMLCQQHGSVQFFNQNSAARLAVVSFTRSEDALKAQHALNGYVIANTQLAADFIPDAEVGKLANFGDQSTSLNNIWSAAPGVGIPGGHAPLGHSNWHSGLMAGGGGGPGGNSSLWSTNGCSNSVGGL